MPRNGSGQYNPLTNTWNPPVNGVLATGSDFQAQLNDISAAITQSVSKDGQTPMTASFPMGNNSIVGIASGTAAAPSISPINDTNTGLYFPAADTVGVAVGGVQALLIDNTGIEVPAGTEAAPSLTTTGDTNTGLYFPAADTVAIVTGATERARHTSLGSLLVGTTDDTTGNQIVATGRIGFLTGSSIPQINYYSSASTIEFVNRNSGGAKTFSWFYGASGGGTPATLSTSGVWTNASDARGKDNIKDIGYGLSTVLALQPRQYDVKSDGSHAIGFVSQEVLNVIPEIVHGSEEKFYGLDYGSLGAVLAKAIQEQQALIDAQKTAIESLTARITALESK